RTLRVLFKGELWRGRDNLRVSFRRPIDWTALPSAILPVVDAVLLGVAVIGLLGGLASWPRTAVPAIVSLLVVAGFAFLKAVRAAVRERRGTVAAIAQAFVVASVYDVARALAVFAKVPHRNIRPKTAATTAS